MHDPRIGRFFAVDPLSNEYPYYTPYSFSGNIVGQMAAGGDVDGQSFILSGVSGFIPGKWGATKGFYANMC